MSKFELENEILVTASKSEIIRKLKQLSVFSIFTMFTEKNFKFKIKGEKGLYNATVILLVTGEINDISNKKIVTYKIKAHKFFWIWSLVNVAVVIYSTILLIRGEVELYYLLIVPFIFQLLNYIVMKHQMRVCNEKIIDKMNEIN